MEDIQAGLIKDIFKSGILGKLFKDFIPDIKNQKFLQNDQNNSFNGFIQDYRFNNSHHVIEKIYFNKDLELKKDETEKDWEEAYEKIVNLDDLNSTQFDDRIYPCDQYLKFDTGQTYKFEFSQSPKNKKERVENIALAITEVFPEDKEVSEILDKIDKNSENKTNQEEINENVESCKKIQIELSKIKSSNEIVCGRIYCNYEPLEVYEDLEDILDSEEFIKDLTDESQIFEIIPSEEEYNIQNIETIQSMNYVSQVLKFQFITLMQLYSTKWNIDLLDKNPLSFISIIRWQLDWMISSRLCANISIAEILKSITSEEIEPNGDVSNIVENYCTVLDLYYSNFPHEVQKLLDDWLLTLRY